VTETCYFPGRWLIILTVKNGSLDAVANDRFKMTKRGKTVHLDLYNLLVGVCWCVTAQF